MAMQSNYVIPPDSRELAINKYNSVWIREFAGMTLT